MEHVQINQALGTANKLGAGASVFLVIGMVAMFAESIPNRTGLALIFYSVAFGLKHWESLILRREVQ